MRSGEEQWVVRAIPADVAIGNRPLAVSFLIPHDSSCSLSRTLLYILFRPHLNVQIVHVKYRGERG